MSQDNDPTFLPHHMNRNLEWLSPRYRRAVTTVRQIGPDLSDNQLRKRVSELLPPEQLYKEDARSFKDLYQDLVDYLKKRGATLPTHFSQRIVRILANRLYAEPEESKVANRFTVDIQQGRSSKPDLFPTPSNGDDGRKPHTKPLQRIAHNVTMRLRDSNWKFGGDTTKRWDEYVDTYNQMAKDHRHLDEKKVQFLYNTPTNEAL